MRRGPTTARKAVAEENSVKKLFICEDQWSGSFAWWGRRPYFWRAARDVERCSWTKSGSLMYIAWSCEEARVTVCSRTGSARFRPKHVVLNCQLLCGVEASRNFFERSESARCEGITKKRSTSAFPHEKVRMYSHNSKFGQYSQNHGNKLDTPDSSTGIYGWATMGRKQQATNDG